MPVFMTRKTARFSTVAPGRLVPVLLLLALWLSACTPATEPEAVGDTDSDSAETTVVAEGAADSVDATPESAEPTMTSFTVKVTVAPQDPASDVAVDVGDRMQLVNCGGMPCPYVGPKDAPVTVIEVTDYQCGYCREFVQDSMPAILAEYVEAGQVRFVSHVLGWIPEVQPIANAAMCALAEGKYFVFQDAAFEHELGLVAEAELDAAILEAAATVELTSKSFRECVEGRPHMAAVERSTREAESAGIVYTPSVIINGLLIEGAMPIEVYRAKIESALAEVEAQTEASTP